MFRSHPVVTVIGLTILLASCGEDSMPPSEPGVERVAVPAAHVRAAARSLSRTQFREVGALAQFSSFDASGCVVTDAFVIGAQQAAKLGPGQPTRGPVVIVLISEFNFCTFEFLRDIFGETTDASVQADRKLSAASMEATIPAFDFVNQVPVQVVVDLAWTGAGELTSESQRFRSKGPLSLVNFSFKGTTRPAEVSGTLTVDGENVATSVLFADIYRAKVATFERLSIP
jgi:hypothetical protein